MSLFLATELVYVSVRLQICTAERSRLRPPTTPRGWEGCAELGGRAGEGDRSIRRPWSIVLFFSPLTAHRSVHRRGVCSQSVCGARPFVDAVPFAGHRLPMPAASTGEDSSVTRHSQAVPLLAVPDGIFTRSGGFLSCLSIKKAKRNPKNISTARFEHNLLIRSQAPCPLGHADYLNDGGSVCARSYTVRLQKRIKTSSSCRNSRPRPAARRFRRRGTS